MEPGVAKIPEPMTREIMRIYALEGERRREVTLSGVKREEEVFLDVDWAWEGRSSSFSSVECGAGDILGSWRKNELQFHDLYVLFIG